MLWRFLYEIHISLMLSWNMAQVLNHRTSPWFWSDADLNASFYSVFNFEVLILYAIWTVSWLSKTVVGDVTMTLNVQEIHFSAGNSHFLQHHTWINSLSPWNKVHRKKPIAELLVKFAAFYAIWLSFPSFQELDVDSTTPCSIVFFQDAL
jgi:hypothetical protein